MSFRNVCVCFILFLPAAARGAGPGADYFIAVQSGAYNFKGGEIQLEESHKALREMVKLADAQNVRLTLLFSAQYADYIASDTARLAELEGWKKTGHEIGAYHQGPDTRAWDGYSDLPGEALTRVRKEGGKSAFAPDHREYLAALARLAPEIKTGCMTDKADKKFIAAAPPYEICGAAQGQGKKGAGAKGVNEFIAVAKKERSRKRLSSFHPADKAGIEAAKSSFSGLQSGVYGVLFKSSPSEFGAFYIWLSFLKNIDPQGLRSRTVSAIVDGKVLTEKEAGSAPARREVKEQSVTAQPEPAREIPRLKPVQSQFGRAGGLVPGLRRRMTNIDQRGYCGDGICDAFERAHPGRCPRDCGN